MYERYKKVKLSALSWNEMDAQETVRECAR